MISPGLNSCENSLNTLRYADRVKELGASDPAMASSGRGPLNDYEEEMMDNEDDLAQLRSLNVRVLFFVIDARLQDVPVAPLPVIHQSDAFYFPWFS